MFTSCLFIKKKTGMKILPGSLAEAVNELEKDEVIKDALGTHIFERFISAKRSEWEDYRLEVTPWELDKYLPHISNPFFAFCLLISPYARHSRQPVLKFILPGG